MRQEKPALTTAAILHGARHIRRWWDSLTYQQLSQARQRESAIFYRVQDLMSAIGC
jgi:uncharacterized protein (DUF1330 family)